MLIIPAIDLRAGRTVRLLYGDFERETVYGTDPVAVACRWQAGGAELLHVVDLDGARQDRPVQLDLVASIATVLPVQVGGGIRSQEDVASVLGIGAQRVVIGTPALNPTLVAALVAEHGPRLVVALDTKGGKVAVRGWTEASDWTLLNLAQRLLDVGVQRFLHTDIERDGALTSPNYDSLAALIALGAPVIASGGVASLDQIDRLRSLGAEAVIVGRALYEQAFSLEEAIARAG